MPALVLTTEDLQAFVGGQCMVSNKRERYIYCGEVESVVVSGEGRSRELVIEFAWLVKGTGYPPAPKRWVCEYSLNGYRANLATSIASETGNGVIGLICLGTRDLVKLSPPGQGLDPTEVEGLVLRSQSTN